MSSQSIHRRLVQTLSLSITLVIILILLLTDIAVDTWIHDEFERAMENKAKLLSTLVSVGREGVEFDLTKEFMPEFFSGDDPEYFKLWRGTKDFKYSSTLKLFSKKTFEYFELGVGEKYFIDTDLPDGRTGIILYYRFMPKINSNIRDEFEEFNQVENSTHSPMLLAYAMSSAKLNFVAYLIDISFIVAALFVVFMVRILVTRTVKNGLQPLNELTESLKGMTIADKAAELVTSQQIEELIPIQQSINTFIRENQALYQKEQRLTSDIAHELKTPIAELISMAEVANRFPEDRAFAQAFVPDVLNVGKRLQHIVSNLLLLNSYSNAAFEKNDVFDAAQVLSRLSPSLEDRIVFTLQDSIEPINSNLFAFETIFGNLINNAIAHSPANSLIAINVSQRCDCSLCVSITNNYTGTLEENDLKAMFAPLWQKDSARSSTSNFGLGLSIVQSFCRGLNGTIDVGLDDKKITFTVSIPK